MINAQISQCEEEIMKNITFKNIHKVLIGMLVLAVLMISIVAFRNLNEGIARKPDIMAIADDK